MVRQGQLRGPDFLSLPSSVTEHIGWRGAAATLNSISPPRMDLGRPLSQSENCRNCSEALSHVRFSLVAV